MDQSQADAVAHYRARSFTWSIQAHDRSARALINEIFADLVASPTRDATNVVIVGADGDRSRLVLSQDGQTATYGRSQLIDQLVSFLNQGVLASATNTIDLHASAMSDPTGSRTIVTVAPSGGGKTTVAAHLCKAGWSYLSDETVGIDLDHGSLVGCGKPLTVKEGLHTTLGIDLAPLTIANETQTRWYVRPGLLGGSVKATAPPPTDLVFINFDLECTATEIHQVPPHQALMQLLSNTYELDRHGARVLPTLARLIASSRVWEVHTANGADAVYQLLAAIGEVSPASRQVQHHLSADVEPISGPAPAAGLVFAGFAEVGAVVHDHVRSEAVLLDPVGAMVWQLLDGSVSIPDLAQDLADHFDTPAETIRTDVESVCNELAANGFLNRPL